MQLPELNLCDPSQPPSLDSTTKNAATQCCLRVPKMTQTRTVKLQFDSKPIKPKTKSVGCQAGPVLQDAGVGCKLKPYNKKVMPIYSSTPRKKRKLEDLMMKIKQT